MKALLISIILFSSSCSFKRLVVPNIPYLINRQISKQIYLYGDQEDYVQEGSLKIIKQEIDRARILQKRLNSINLDEFNAMEEYLFLRSQYEPIADKFSHMLSKLLSQLDKKQIKKFLKLQGDYNKNLAKRINNTNDEKILKRFSFFFGELNPSQKKIVLSHIDIYKELSRERLIRRQKANNQIMLILNNKQNPERESQLYKLLKSTSQRDQLSIARKKSIEIFQRIVNTLSKDQKEYFYKKRSEYNDWINYFIKYYSRTS